MTRRTGARTRRVRGVVARSIYGPVRGSVIQRRRGGRRSFHLVVSQPRPKKRGR